MTACNFERKGTACVCPVCGLTIITTKACERIHANCDPSKKRQAIDLTQESQPKRDPMKCLHLGSPTGRNVPVLGCGGCGTRGETAVFECELHWECTPLARQTDSQIRSCVGCESFTTTPPTSPASPPGQ